jgi:HD-GYP domain-containing protein (c-di-GMP phosphodiesterase class II)
MTVKTKLTTSSILLIALVIVVGTTLLLGYRDLNNKTAIAYQLDNESMYLQMMLRGLNEVILNEGTPDSVDIARTALKGFDSIHKDLLSRVENPDVHDKLEDIYPKFIDIKIGIEPYLENHYFDLDDHELLIKYGGLIRETEDISNEINLLARNTKAQLDSSQKKILYTISLFSSCMLILIGIYLFGLYKSVTRPIGDLLTIAEGFYKGDLSVKMDETRKDEFGSLARHFNKSIANLNLMSRELRHSNSELIIAYDNTIKGWSRAMDMRDKETEGHSQRVTDMTVIIAREMGIKDEDLVHIRRGALLHDMGKLGVPDSILFKPDKLTEEEWVIMKMHPEYAYEMLYPIEHLRLALDIPRYHHETWDGTGYPKGLKGERIPIAARIFAVVDVWDALCSDRPYRPAWPKEKIVEHIRSLSGTHFAPEVLEVFFQINWEITSGELTIAPDNPAIPASYVPTEHEDNNRQSAI